MKQTVNVLYLLSIIYIYHPEPGIIDVTIIVLISIKRATTDYYHLFTAHNRHAAVQTLSPLVPGRPGFPCGPGGPWNTST